MNLKKLLALVVILIAWSIGGPLYAQTITTVAGSTGIGDGGPATQATVVNPTGVAVDANGNVYIAEQENNRIRKVSPGGTITTVAGTGMAGFSGDGGLATSAQINFPTGIAFDAANNLYIADNRNHRIRRVSPAGIISTVAGNGTQGFSGDNGLATATQLWFPWKVTVSASGLVFVADNGNSRVRRIGTDGVISTVAGTYSRGFSGDEGAANLAQLNGPFGLGLDGAGNMLIADAYNARIRKVSCVDTPVVNIVVSSTNVCVGDEIILTASATGNTENLSYTWSLNTVPKGINTVSLTAVSGNNSFLVIATTPTGCATTASGSFTAAKLASVKSGDWHDPATWSCGRVPSGEDTVTISNGHSVTILQAAEAKSLVLNGSVINEPGGSLSLLAKPILLGGTTWDCLIIHSNTVYWHADVTFNADGTTIYDEPEYPGQYTSYGFWKLTDNQISWSLDKERELNYTFTGTISGDIISGTWGLDSKPWTAKKR